jgi:hypothetical protein
MKDRSMTLQRQAVNVRYQNMLWTYIHCSKEEDDHEEEDDDDLKLALEQYRLQRMKELLDSRQPRTQRPFFGSYRSIQAKEFAQQVDQAPSGITVLIHLYHNVRFRLCTITSIQQWISTMVLDKNHLTSHGNYFTMISAILL